LVEALGRVVGQHVCEPSLGIDAAQLAVSIGV
jgi:hypothetical protein